jgi:hypothetical protein
VPEEMTVTHAKPEIPVFVGLKRRVEPSDLSCRGRAVHDVGCEYVVAVTEEGSVVTNGIGYAVEHSVLHPLRVPINKIDAWVL